MWYVPAKSKYADSKSSASLRGTWLKKKVPDRNIGVPPVRKYANYRTLPGYDVSCKLSFLNSHRHLTRASLVMSILCYQLLTYYIAIFVTKYTTTRTLGHAENNFLAREGRRRS
jgi:hypothetical protein